MAAATSEMYGGMGVVEGWLTGGGMNAKMRARTQSKSTFEEPPLDDLPHVEQSQPSMPPGDGAARHVFVSYASADRTVMRFVAAALERARVRVWVDRDAIMGGTNYGPEIVAAIRECGALVLICSAAAYASRNVRQEVALAWKHERPILPLLGEQVALPDDLAYWLEAAQWVEVLDRPEGEWLPQVLQALHRG